MVCRDIADCVAIVCVEAYIVSVNSYRSNFVAFVWSNGKCEVVAFVNGLFAVWSNRTAVASINCHVVSRQVAFDGYALLSSKRFAVVVADSANAEAVFANRKVCCSVSSASNIRCYENAVVVDVYSSSTRDCISADCYIVNAEIILIV